MRELDEYEDDVIELGREILACESATGYKEWDAFYNLCDNHQLLLHVYVDIAIDGDQKPYNELLLRSACELVEDYYKQGDV